MKLYIDLELKKAVSIPNTATAPKSGREARASYISSFDNRPGGVSGASASPDRPEVGKKWADGEESGDTVDAELDSQLEDDAKVDKDRGVIKGLVKAVVEQAVSNSDLPNNVEVEFLKSLGHTDEDIRYGRAVIAGRDRSKFTSWVMSRVVTDPAKILGGRL